MRQPGIGVLGALAVVAGVGILGASVSAQSAAGPQAVSYAPPLTADGQPDLQGVWDYRTITPMERPRGLGEKQVFTAEEAAAFEQDENRRQNRDLGGGNYPSGGVVPYNEFWYDRGSKLLGTKRTSLVVEPADGRIPALTADAQKKAAARAAASRDDQLGLAHADSYTDRPLGERCIMGFNAGPPMTPAAYNNNFQIVQSRDYVVILNEMVHNARIVPLDGRAHLTMPQWAGSSRGRWEGSTLVVESTNFYSQTSLANSGPNLRLVERFTRVAPDTLIYEFAVSDPTVWTTPWKAQIATVNSPDHLYEYACHEGNSSIIGVLAGARADEKAAAGSAKKGSN